jgi:hypothetical protein
LDEHSLPVLALSLGDLTCARRLRWSADALAQMLGSATETRRGMAILKRNISRRPNTTRSLQPRTPGTLVCWSCSHRPRPRTKSPVQSNHRSKEAPRWIAAALTLVIVAAVFWSGACVNDREEQRTASAGDDNGSPPNAPSPVEAYIEFVATVGDPPARLSDDQMAEGLRKLAGALGTLNAGGPDLLIDLRAGAEHVLLNPASTETAAIIREAMVAAADAIERGSGPDLALRETARSVRPDLPVIEQRAAVLHFFRQAADAIQRQAPDGAPSAARSVRQPVAFAPISRL